MAIIKPNNNTLSAVTALPVKNPPRPNAAKLITRNIITLNTIKQKYFF